MNICHGCRSTQSQEGFIDEVFNINGALVLVKQIPARVCTNCGEVIFGRETVEKVRPIVSNSTMTANFQE